MYEWQVNETKEFMEENNIKCEGFFFEPKFSLKRRQQNALESAFKLKETIASADSSARCIEGSMKKYQVICEFLNKLPENFVIPQRPEKISLEVAADWSMYYENISKILAETNRITTELRVEAVGKVFDDAIINIPKEKNIICIKSKYLPKQVNINKFDAAIAEMVSGERKEPFGITCILWYEWIAFMPAAMSVEKLQELKKLYMGDATTAEVTYA